MATRGDVSALVAEAAATRPGAVALVDQDGRATTWRALEDEVARVATGIGEAGMVPGYRVVLAMGNRVELVTAYLSLLRAHVVAVPVDPALPAQELARVLADTRARLVVADRHSIGAARAAVRLVRRPDSAQSTPTPGPPIPATPTAGAPTPGAPPEADPADGLRQPRLVVVDAEPAPGERSWAELRAAQPRPLPAVRDPESLAALLYTSGSSGRPRAAMLSHRALLADIEQLHGVQPPIVTGDDVVLGALPLFHGYGVNAVLGLVVRAAATLVLVERPDPMTALDLVAARACTVVPLSPAVLERWLEVDDLRNRLASVRLVVSGSAALGAELADRFAAATGLPMHQGYGLTEAGPVVTSTLCSRSPRPGSVGAPLPRVGLRLVDPDGREPEPGDPGEIEISGPNLFSGYWPDGHDGPDAEGWWPTGDLGLLDAAGDLTLVDAVGDVVVVAGFPVYPREVEEVLRGVPGVVAAGVIGVPDPAMGSAVVAYVVAPGGEPAAVAEAVRRHCEQQLARFKRPSRVEVVPELPTTVTGTVQKGRLRGRERRHTPETSTGGASR